MNTINTINIGGIDREIEDTVARAGTGTQLGSRVSTLETKVDQIITPSGGAPNPNEIIDARIGVDDTVYNSLGESIRNQINGTRDIEKTFESVFDPGSPYSNMFNYKTVNEGWDVVTETGALIKRSAFVDYFTSDFIYIEHPEMRLQGYNISRFLFVYDENKEYLGYITLGDDLNAIITNTFAAGKYIRIQGLISNERNIVLMYYDNRTSEYIPFNQIDGNLWKSRYLYNAVAKDLVTFGYFYNKGILDLDLTGDESEWTYTIKGDLAYILTNNSYQNNTHITVNEPHPFVKDPQTLYFFILYDKKNNTFVGKTDFTGDFRDYVLFGCYDHGVVYGNLGLVTINGEVRNYEIQNALDSSEIAKNFVTFGYFYNKGILDLDLSGDKSGWTYKIKCDQAYILSNNSYQNNTHITVNTPHQFSVDSNLYFFILYDKKNNTFVGKTDFTGDFRDYVLFGCYDHGVVYGNLGVVTINGKVCNYEIQNALSGFDFSGLTERIDDNSTAIGVNASAITAEAATRASNDAALSARIDNLVAPSGTSVAEIVDARVGYDGTSYASLAARLNAEAGRVRNVLVVGTGGQYQTINAAVTAASNGDIIFIKRGVYEEEVLNQDKLIHIVGESKEEVVWKYPNTEYGHDVYRCGMGSIRNLTIWAYDNGGTPPTQYGRNYCLHIDDQSHYEQNPPISNYFYCENVHFINDSNECAGLGLRNNMIMEFVNCDFETLSGNEAAFYVHSAEAINAKCIMKGCTIRNNSTSGQLAALRIEGYWVTDGGCTAVLERNIVVNLGGGPVFVMQKDRHHGSQTVQNWQGVSDWLLDPRSQLNNISDINYTP